MLKSLGINAWKEETLADLADKILSISSKPLVLIDGKAGAGKTSFAVKLAEFLNANLVASDDVAWWSDPIHWDEEMLNGIIEPWLNGKNAAYTPSGWIKKHRDGFIEVDSGKALIIEGCGTCRKTLRKVANFSIWIDTDSEISRERVINRDIAKGENGGTLESVTEFTDWWESIVDPFLLEEEAWKYADLIVSGSHSDINSDVLCFALYKRDLLY
ncbi:MAG: hypothetical protein FWC09_10225 [Lachnospiraceae bacterium]|nr:hypothetical protein [Lachnospiraceae bacterium]